MRCCERDRMEAEDVLHATYCKVLDGRALFEGRSEFKTWLFGVIQRTAREQARWGWLRLTRLERWWEGAKGDGSGDNRGDGRGDDRGNNPGDRMGEGDGDARLGVLTNALTRLSPRQQQVLHLVFYQELTIQGAADVLDMPVGTARTHYERGKARLRQLLTASEET